MRKHIFFARGWVGLLNELNCHINGCQKQVVGMKSKIPLTFLSISFRSRDIQVFKICKLAK